MKDLCLNSHERRMLAISALPLLLRRMHRFRRGGAGPLCRGGGTKREQVGAPNSEVDKRSKGALGCPVPLVLPSTVLPSSTCSILIGYPG